MKRQNNKLAVTVKVKEEVVIAKNNYQKMFLAGKKMNKRGDKSIYVSAENHKKLMRIVRVIGEDKVPLYAYLDNILAHHFTVFEHLLTKEFTAKNKPLF